MDGTLHIASRALWRREGDVVVVLDEVSGEASLLDPVAADVFELLRDGPDLETLLERLGERYEGDSAVMRSDVCELADELIARHLVERREG